MEIKKLHYNWFYSNECGEEYDIAEVGSVCARTQHLVVEIKEHRAQGDGDKWYYDVIYCNGSEMRVYNPNLVLRS